VSAIGLHSRDIISDDQFSASSSASSQYAPSAARINNDPGFLSQSAVSVCFLSLFFFCFYQLVSIAIGILVQCIMYVCMYVCMYVIFIRCDKRTSNNKHKKQSQNVDVQYKAAKPKKLFHLTKLYKERIRKDFL